MDQGSSGSCTYLDNRHSGFEPAGELRQDLRQQRLVFQHFPHLHDPHDGRLVRENKKGSQKFL